MLTFGAVLACILLWQHCIAANISFNNLVISKVVTWARFLGLKLAKAVANWVCKAVQPQATLSYIIPRVATGRQEQCPTLHLEKDARSGLIHHTPPLHTYDDVATPNSAFAMHAPKNSDTPAAGTAHPRPSPGKGAAHLVGIVRRDKAAPGSRHGSQLPPGVD